MGVFNVESGPRRDRQSVRGGSFKMHMGVSRSVQDGLQVLRDDSKRYQDASRMLQASPPSTSDLRSKSKDLGLKI